jgi:hypothetical protein
MFRLPRSHAAPSVFAPALCLPVRARCDDLMKSATGRLDNSDFLNAPQGRFPLPGLSGRVADCVWPRLGPVRRCLRIDGQVDRRAGDSEDPRHRQAHGRAHDAGGQTLQPLGRRSCRELLPARKKGRFPVPCIGQSLASRLGAHQAGAVCKGLLARTRNSLGMVACFAGQVNLDPDDYVSEKALNGLLLKWGPRRGASAPARSCAVANGSSRCLGVEAGGSRQ